MKRIRYVSQFARPLDRLEVDGIVAVSQKNNARLDVTGVLMTSGRMFFQLIEGPDPAVDMLWQRIREDDRHTDILLLSEERGLTERLFPDWAMHRIDLGQEADERLEPIRELLEVVVEQRERIRRLTNTLERAIWRELSMARRNG